MGPSRDNLDQDCEKWKCDPWQHPILLGLTGALKDYRARTGRNRTIARIRSLYNQYTFAKVASHPAMIIMPYQVFFRIQSCFCCLAAHDRLGYALAACMGVGEPSAVA